MNIRLYNARILTMEKNRPVFRGEIWVRNEKIVYIAEEKDLERDFSIKGATATNILKPMEKDGVIRRVPLERDARLKKLVLTEKGYRLDAIAHDNIENLEIGIRKGLSEEEITIFSNILDKIAQNIEDLIKENPKEN